MARMDPFTSAYFEAALWSSTDNSDDSGGEPLDANYSVGDIAEDTKAKMMADCADFQDRFSDLIYEDHSAKIVNYGAMEVAGHDFWLTRNGHGAGFWDGDWPKNGDKLTEACKEYGEFDLYVGDDGEIHGSPLESRRKGASEARGVVRAPSHRVAAVPQHPLPFGTKVRVRDMPEKGVGTISGSRPKEQIYEVKFGPGDFWEYPFGQVDPLSGGHLNERGGTVRDYAVVDRQDRTVAGPFKSYQDARNARVITRDGELVYDSRKNKMRESGASKYRKKQNPNDALLDDVFLGDVKIGHIKGPIQRKRGTGSDYYSWSLDVHTTPGGGAFGTSKSRDLAFQSLIREYERRVAKYGARR